LGALSYIKRLYTIDSIAKQREYSAEQIEKIQQDQAKPILDDFNGWLGKRFVETPPKGLLGKAIAYALNQLPLMRTNPDPCCPQYLDCAQYLQAPLGAVY